MPSVRFQVLLETFVARGFPVVRLVDILALEEIPPNELAAVRFALARVLWASPAEQQTSLVCTRMTQMPVAGWCGPNVLGALGLAVEF